MRTAEEWANHFGLRPGFAELFRMVQHDTAKEAYSRLRDGRWNTAAMSLSELVEELEAPEPNLVKLAVEGFWQCKDCQGIDTRQDGEQGQPDHCNRCGSVRLKYHPPTLTTDHHEQTDQKNTNPI